MDLAKDAPVVTAGSRGMGVVGVAAAALLLWLLACWPLLAGSRTFFYRDLFTYVAPLKAFGAAELAHGRVPALNPTWALGQVYRGDPNALAFYPSNVFYLVLPFWVAFNLHLCLHWLLAAVAMTTLARQLGRSAGAALLAGIAYGGGGFVLSSISFYNSLTVVAWWPLVLWGAHRGGRRGLAVGALCCGLALLGGEPVLVAVGLVPLLLIAVVRWGRSRGLLYAGAIVVAGILVALPQIVATLRVLPFSFRGAHGVTAGEADLYRFQAVRLLELLTLDAWGHGAWPARWVPQVPYFYALYPGVVATLLALVGSLRQRAWALLALAGILLAWSPFVPGVVIARLSGGLFRYPEKWLFWLALSLPLLAAAGFDRARLDRRGALRMAFALIAVLGVVAVALPTALRGAAAPGRHGVPSSAVLVLLLLVLSAWATWRRMIVGLIVLELLAIAPLKGLPLSDAVAPYSHPSPWLARIGDRRGILVQPARLTEEPVMRARSRAFALGPVPGVTYGLTYPLSADTNGMHTTVSDYMNHRLPMAAFPPAWLRTLGVEVVVTSEPVRAPGVRVVEAASVAGTPLFLQLVDGAAPFVRWPARLQMAPTPGEAMEAVSTRADLDTAVVPIALRHAPGGSVRLVSAAADRVVLETAGNGGLVVVRRAYVPLWRARSGRQPLRVVPVDLALTGVEVPSGHRRVELFVPAQPEAVGAVVALLCAFALAAVAVRPGRGAERPPAPSD